MLCVLALVVDGLKAVTVIETALNMTSALSNVVVDEVGTEYTARPEPLTDKVQTADVVSPSEQSNPMVL